MMTDHDGDVLDDWEAPGSFDLADLIDVDMDWVDEAFAMKIGSAADDEADVFAEDDVDEAFGNQLQIQKIRRVLFANRGRWF